MIIRNEKSEKAWCISQIHHSLMTGELAAAWNISKFGSTKLFKNVQNACLMHDWGWLDWEANPAINPDTGHPFDFLSMPKKYHGEIWMNGAEQTAALDPLLGLLVLRHNLTLSGKDDSTNEEDPLKLSINHMKKLESELESKVIPFYENIAQLEMLSKEEISEMSDFVLLMDYISLIMCMGHDRSNPFGSMPLWKGHSFHISKGKLVEGGEEQYLLDPWPFMEECFSWSLRMTEHHTSLPDKPFQEFRVIERKVSLHPA
ncbi:MAG: DUF3891 family protein [Balneolales bacterium]|nr:DUF3891 family protein [Balneolales bacterium]